MFKEDAKRFIFSELFELSGSSIEQIENVVVEPLYPRFLRYFSDDILCVSLFLGYHLIHLICLTCLLLIERCSTPKNRCLKVF